MPTALRIGPYRFFFCAGDRREPPHVHVERENKKAKYWLEPVRFESNRGFRADELNRISTLIEENSEQLLKAWNGYFGN
jgi:hypothetical protein